MRLTHKMMIVFGLSISLVVSGCAAGNNADAQKSSSESYEQERIQRFTVGYCEFVNDLTVASSYFYTVINSGMSFSTGNLYAGSWVYRIGEMLKINKLESTPEGKWIAGYAAFFEDLDTKLKDSDIRPSKKELGKLRALVQALESQTTGFKKWDACSSSYELSLEDMQSQLDANESFQDFLDNQKK